MSPDDDDDYGFMPTGGFKDAQARTLDALAKACRDRNIPEAQRLAKHVLTWWTPQEGYIDLPWRPSPPKSESP